MPTTEKPPTSPTLDRDPLRRFVKSPGAGDPPAPSEPKPMPPSAPAPAATKPASPPSSDQTAPKPDANQAATKDAKPAAEPPGEPTTPAASPDTPGATDPQPGTAPWFQHELEKRDKQYKNMQSHTGRVERENKELSNRVKELEKLVKGDEDTKAKETEEQKQLREDLERKEAISRKVAEDQHGADKIHELIYADESPFKKLIAERPWLQTRLVHAEAPVLEALAILEEEEVLGTLGRSVKGIREKLSKELREEHFKQFQNEVTNAPAERSKGPSKGLSDVRNQDTVARKAEGSIFGQVNLRKINPHIGRVGRVGG